MSHYAKDIGVSVPTIKRWISILEASYVLFLLPPFYQNFGKRIAKSPKIYFFDTGLVSYLTGIQTFEQYDRGPLAGALFENYIMSEIYKRELHLATNAELYYIRTQDKIEIDLVLDYKSKREFIEIKKSATFKLSMLKGLKTFKSEKDQYRLIYQGKSDKIQDIEIMPYTDYLS